MNDFTRAVVLTQQHELDEAVKDLDRAKKRYHLAVESLYDAGTPVLWEHGSYIRRGHVVTVSWCNRVLVRSDKSGKKMWIEAYRLRALEGGDS